VFNCNTNTLYFNYNDVSIALNFKLPLWPTQHFALHSYTHHSQSYRCLLNCKTTEVSKNYHIYFSFQAICHTRQVTLQEIARE
jgi:hypothetical protein